MAKKNTDSILKFVFSEISMADIQSRALKANRLSIYNLTEEEKTTIIKCGLMGYSIDQLITILQPDDESGFTEMFETPGSEIHKLYHQGPLQYEFEIDSQLIDLAQKGDKEAIEWLKNKKEQQKTKKHF
jgi:hypothetical protein